MPAKDAFHDLTKLALEKDGWTITHDPLTLEIGLRQIYIDLFLTLKQGRFCNG